MRDITLEETVYFNFTTRAFASGVPTTLSGSPVLSVLESNNATPITAGVSVSVDRASVAGLNQATVVATAANGYEAGKSYAVYVSTGTVGGVSVIGEVVAQFTIQAAAAFTRLGAPAGASVSADVAAIKAETAAILADTNELQTDWANGGRLDLILDARASQTSVDDLPTTAELATALGTADDAVLTAIADLPTTAELATALGTADDAVLAAIGDLPTALENADALLNRDMSAVSDTNDRSPLNALRFLRNKWGISGTTLSVTKEDDSTPAWTATVTAAPGADPISGSDPA